MESLDYWRLCEEFNIVQAALLVVGSNPDIAENVEDWPVDGRPDGYEAAKTAICGGLRNYARYENELSKPKPPRFDDFDDYPVDLEARERFISNLLERSIVGHIRMMSVVEMPGYTYFDGPIHLYTSTVNAESLKEWLRSKGFTTGFFFPEPIATLDFLDPKHPRYAPKLAASVKAWQAVTDPVNRSTKQTLAKWLREHAVEFGLTNEEGQPIETAIEECSKVANWDTKGGATKTPT